MIADKLLMAKNNRGTENDRRMIDSNGHVQHKHGKQSVGSFLEISGSEAADLFRCIPVIDKNGLKCEVQSCDVLPTK